MLGFPPLARLSGFLVLVVAFRFSVFFWRIGDVLFKCVRTYGLAEPLVPVLPYSAYCLLTAQPTADDSRDDVVINTVICD